VTHKDFEVIFDIDMKIEDGLSEDFTFNAAYDPIKDIIYDYWWINDLRDKVIRHI
jgi:tRNA nucleotidyltransferase/poly(A) polymerase